MKPFCEFYPDTLMKEKDIDWVFFSPAGSGEPAITAWAKTT